MRPQAEAGDEATERASHATVPGVAGLWRDSVLTLGDRVVSLLLGVVAVALATRLLGPEGYGGVALALSAVQLLYAVGVHWTMAAIVRFGREAQARGEPAGPILASWLALVGACTITALAAAGLLAPWLRPWLDPSSISLAVVVVLFLAVVAAKVQEHVRAMASLVRAQVGGRLLGRLVFCASLLLLLASAPPGRGRPGQVVLAMALGFAVQAATVVPSLFGPTLRGFSVRAALLGPLLAYSAPFLGRSAASFVLEWVDVFFLRIFRTTAEIGLYQVGYQLMIVTTEALGSILVLAFPLLTEMRARSGPGPAKRFASRLLPQGAVLWSVLVPTLGLLASFAVPIVLGPSFAPVSRLLGLLFVAASFQVVIYGALPVLASHDLLGPAMRITFVMVAVNVALDLVLAPRAGALGTAVATAVTYAVGALLHAGLLGRALEVGVLPLVLPSALGVPALLAISFGLPVGVQVLLLLGGVFFIWAWARSRGVFAEDDLTLFDEVSLPPWGRASLRRLYRALGRTS